MPPPPNAAAFGGMQSQQAQYDLAQQYPEAYLEHFRQQGKRTQLTLKSHLLRPFAKNFTSEA
jgi:hypothetical protein